MTKMRKAAGLSQAELAEAAGVHVNTVANIERGIGDPSVIKLSRILVRLRCPGIVFEEAGFFLQEPREDCDFIDLSVDPSCIAAVIGSRIREKRVSAGLTLRQLADGAGIHPNTVWNIENGLVEASVSVVYRLYQALGVSRVEKDSSSISVS
jgi:transcriptional regulator with XRE-family HTH domain